MDEKPNIEMEVAEFTKKFTIIMDPIRGSIDYEVDKDITYGEILGAIEYVKMMVMKEWMDEVENG